MAAEKIGAMDSELLQHIETPVKEKKVISKVNKVAIVGYTSSRVLAPYDNPDFEIWGLNDLYKYIPRYDRWFELHKADDVIREHAAGRMEGRTSWEENLKALSEMKCPVYMEKVDPRIPMSMKFPLDKILDHFGKFFLDKQRVRYFTNSVSYMVALATMEEFKEIHLYGVDMSVGTEFSEQRASCEFWLGVALGRGIKLHIPEQSDLLMSMFLYAFEDDKRNHFLSKLGQIETDVLGKAQAEERAEREARDRRLQFVGAQMAIKEIRRSQLLDKEG